MLIAMGKAMQGKSLMKLSFDHQNFIVDIFVMFIQEQMKDFRLRCERSKLMSITWVKK